MFSSLFALTFASAVVAAPLLVSKDVTCATGLHMIVARGSTEAQGEGQIGFVTSFIKSAVPGSSSEGIVYPATLDNYQSSESQGAAAMVQAITNYAQACPDGKIALLGYSQGAQVIGDALGGGSFSAAPPVDASLTKNIVAAIQFADPAHIAGKSYDIGSSTRNGSFPRADTTTLDTYSDVLQSYCIKGDKFCDNGSNVFIHLSEVSVNGGAAAAFVISQAKAAGL